MTTATLAAVTYLTPSDQRSLRAHPAGGGAIAVVLHVPAALGASSAQVVGDFTAWTPVAMDRDAAGGFVISVCLPRGRSWRYQFVIDCDRRINDVRADDYVAGPTGAVSVRYT